MIELFHVVKTYAGAERPALDDVNLKINKGEFCLLSGASGAGKTTLLRLLFCAERATAGQVVLNGKNLARLPAAAIPHLRRKIGVVFQDFKLLPDRTVFENVALTLEVQGRASSWIHERVLRVLKEVGLQHRMHHAASSLSGGEQQRTAIARALVGDPLILLCDEPTGNLDPERSRAIMDLLLQAHARGTTVVVATHDPALHERHRGRSLVLEDGRLVHGAQLV